MKPRSDSLLPALAVCYGCIPRADQDRTGYSQGLPQHLGFLVKALWGMQQGVAMAYLNVGLGLQCTLHKIPSSVRFSFLNMSPGWGFNKMQCWHEIQVCRNSCMMSDLRCSLISCPWESQYWMPREESKKKSLENTYNPVTNFKAYHPEAGKPEKLRFCSNKKIFSKHKQRKRNSPLKISPVRFYGICFCL